MVEVQRVFTFLHRWTKGVSSSIYRTERGTARNVTSLLQLRGEQLGLFYRSQKMNEAFHGLKTPIGIII